MKGNDARLWAESTTSRNHVPLDLTLLEQTNVYTATFHSHMNDIVELTGADLSSLMKIVIMWYTMSSYDNSQGMIAPLEKDYWACYKSLDSIVQSYTKNKSKITTTINGEPVRFVAPGYYYQGKEMVVYQLAYLDVVDSVSWSQDYMAKWSQEAHYYALHGADPANIEFTILYDLNDVTKVLKQVEGDTRYLESLVLEVLANAHRKKLGLPTEGYTSNSLKYPNGQRALPLIEEVVANMIEKSS